MELSLLTNLGVLMKCIWLTGIPCSGKTTIAREIVKRIRGGVLLDGDIVRATVLGDDVDFSSEGRAKHILRMGAIAKMIYDSGCVPVCAFVSPDAAVREQVRSLFPDKDFIEIWVATPRSICMARDTKGLWSKAASGGIDNFTGIDGSYEPPEKPELIVSGCGEYAGYACGEFEAQMIISLFAPGIAKGDCTSDFTI